MSTENHLAYKKGVPIWTLGKKEKKNSNSITDYYLMLP